MPAVKAADARIDDQSAHPDPLWRYRALLFSDSLGEAGSLTQFGAFVETLMPGAHSSELHWHETEDEFVLVLSGEVVLVEGDKAGLIETVLVEGDAAVFKAGVPVGHCLQNRSNAPASCLVVGTRTTTDRWHYPLKDEHVTRDGRLRTVRDGNGVILRTYGR
jgi:uncharacterized cupin superfamily protein